MVTQVAGAIALAATQTAHAVLAARGEWVTNEKGLVGRAGLGEVDALVASLTATVRWGGHGGLLDGRVPGQRRGTARSA
ncbi:hypothetical protein GCM10010383_12430 [Streptomyces lomondensis]|uniref:Uncharacterized protein n=1 Tax=Streptomyces lomondensis TaxID=68229 RepID=A0ABQ2WX18_9ACTN|nr:hypothetical protein GCM10010383_12430 [Streptomyces lomondensis]